jgi:uncharacterized protein (DUF488 family)
MTRTIITIGVYGFDETSFFQALIDAKIDIFCDIRRRRGMRGSQYAFANSAYLQQRLSDLGIHYIYLKELAPSPAIRDLQKQADKKQRMAKRSRTGLSEIFIQRYQQECLTVYDSQQFLTTIGPEARVIGLFCVEREPEACHRSLAAQKLSQELHIPLQHIKPTQ